MWIPSPPQRVIGPDAYYPLEGGGVMKEPPPSLIVAGLANFRCWKIFSGRKLHFNVTEKQGVKSSLIKRRNELAFQGFEEQKWDLNEEHFAVA